MSDMIKRVALAIKSGMQHSGVCSLVANGPKGEMALEQFFEVLALDAIEAMREPTDEMKAVEGVHWGYGCHVCGGLTEGWHAMIDAALTPPTD